MTHPIIRFDHATFGFPGTIALEDISLSIPESEFVGVIGPNGSGKTTLCRAVLGLMAPLSGTLRVLDCACEELRCFPAGFYQCFGHCFTGGQRIYKTEYSCGGFVCPI